MWYDSEGHELFRSSNNVDTMLLSCLGTVGLDNSQELTDYAKLWYLWYDSEGHELFHGFNNLDTPPFSRFLPLQFDSSIEVPASQPNISHAHSTAVSSIKGKFVCSICGERFQRRQRLEAHENTHRKKKPYRCDGFCGDIHW